MPPEAMVCPMRQALAEVERVGGPPPVVPADVCDELVARLRRRPARVVVGEAK